jgi:hypothetical protein
MTKQGNHATSEKDVILYWHNPHSCAAVSPKSFERRTANISECIQVTKGHVPKQGTLIPHKERALSISLATV